jgi:UDP-N-acetylglucosamine 2-epimerase (non-hydrolysing)
MAQALRAAGVDHVIVHTGQHYEPSMSDAFFRDLQIPLADVHLGIGSGSHGAQTGAMLTELEPVLTERAPDWVLVYGDTNSTIAGALTAVKMHLPVAHLEAGLRSHNRAMPEEINRVLTDHAADLCLAPTAVAMQNLEGEGLGRRAVLVGDVMTDICLQTKALVEKDPPSAIAASPYVLATLHRAENTDDPQRLRRLVSSLAELPSTVVLAVHPRLRDRAAALGLSLSTGSLVAVDPLDYPSMIAAVVGASAVITDSGGLQKEAYLLRTPCVTLRTETEWPETLAGGWNVLAPDGDDLDRYVRRTPEPISADDAPYGRGDAAPRSVAALLEPGPGQGHPQSRR